MFNLIRLNGSPAGPLKGQCIEKTMQPDFVWKSQQNTTKSSNHAGLCRLGPILSPETLSTDKVSSRPRACLFEDNYSALEFYLQQRCSYIFLTWELIFHNTYSSCPCPELKQMDFSLQSMKSRGAKVK